MTREFKFETLQLHAGQTVDPTTQITGSAYLPDNFLCLTILRREKSFCYAKPGISTLGLPIRLCLRRAVAALEVELEL